MLLGYRHFSDVYCSHSSAATVPTLIDRITILEKRMESMLHFIQSVILTTVD